MDFNYDSASPISSSSSTDLNTSSNVHLTQKRKTGRKKFKETRHQVYRGVRQRNGSKWVCEVREPNKMSRLWLGTFSTPEMAARAHDVAVLALRGENAHLNFPDSAWLLPRPKSSSAKDIKATAFEAAQAFSPSRSSSSTTTAKMTSVEKVENLPEPSRTFWDEEAMFNMPTLLDSMAEGMLLSPPSMHATFSWNDVEDSNIEMSLWN
ncbi:hypothetical protein AQUCO_12200013v1 [Aquilegia coerulea]|uniref:AP2/ERF domain-containing protein n=1 Tax=Aquilegia coerulea TaxID=218851 RepID=A0A2G5C1W0_AQUCA|nr:hypothetical protein AQUCO_12200013v1 [Aquilegia coerulea]